MPGQLRERRVTAPTRNEWRVRRRLSARGLPSLQKWRRRTTEVASSDPVGWVPDVGGFDDIGGLIFAIVACVVIVLVVIPLLLFGIELVLVGVALAAGLIGHVVLGRPWLVEAIPASGLDRPRVWAVKGWRRSGRTVDEVADALAAGREPHPSDGAREVLVAAAPIGGR
jgi:hypothetical protein